MARTNYIHKLEDKCVSLASTIGEISAELNELVVYLYSDKFGRDTTVQVSDVLNRLQHARALASYHSTG